MATFLAAAAKSCPFDAYKIARDELTMMGPVVSLPVAVFF
jgi:hypothetical protein